MHFILDIGKSNYQIKIELYSDLKHYEEIIADLIRKEALYIFLDPSYTISVKAILISLNRSLNSLKDKQFNSKMLQKHFFHYFSPLTDLKELSPLQSKAIFIILINYKEDLILKSGIKEKLEEMDKFVDFEKIKKIYEISKEEITLDTDYRGSVYNYIALKKEFYQQKI